MFYLWGGFKMNPIKALRDAVMVVGLTTTLKVGLKNLFHRDEEE